MRLEMKRLAPGAMNTWFLEVLGTDGGVRFTTAEPKTLWRFERAKELCWKRTELGFEMPFQTITGGIFEVGYPDLIQQMWVAFLMEREGGLDGRLGARHPRRRSRASGSSLRRSHPTREMKRLTSLRNAPRNEFIAPPETPSSTTYS